MSANYENKKVVVEEIKSLAKDAKTIVLVDYKGMNVEQVTELRKEVRNAGGVYKVYKNRLMKLAFEELGINLDSSVYDGTTAVIFDSNDVIAPTKIANGGESKYNKVFKIKAGYVEGKAVDAAYIKQLASIPSKEVLVAQLLGMLTMPMRGLAVAIDQIAKKNA